MIVIDKKLVGSKTNSLLSKHLSITINSQEQVMKNADINLDRTKQVTVVVKNAEEQIIGKNTFAPPIFEPITGLVMSVLASSGKSQILICLDINDGDRRFDITDWDPETQTLEVKVKENAF